MFANVTSMKFNNFISRYLLGRERRYSFTHGFQFRNKDENNNKKTRSLDVIFYPICNRHQEEDSGNFWKFRLPHFHFPFMAHRLYKIGRFFFSRKTKQSMQKRPSRQERTTRHISSAGSRDRSFRKLGIATAQICEFREAFSVFDKDNDGTINSKELGIVMRSLGQNPTEIELWRMINDYDEDGDGTIDFEEFVLMMARLMEKQDWEGDIRESFRVFDREKKGFIHVGDLRYTLINLGEDVVSDEEIEQLINFLDKDGDKQISYDEFAKLLTIMMQRRL